MDPTIPSPAQVRASRYALFETAIGPCGVVWSERGLTHFQLPCADRGATERRLRRFAAAAMEPPPAVQRAIALVQDYMSGKKTDFSGVDLDFAGVPPFNLLVYEAARAVRWGETATYGDIASRIGHPRATREVGAALGQNPVAVIVPCHRILAKGSKPGGFSAPGGVATKEKLLALEGVRLDGDAPFLPGFEPVRAGR
jgi:methylated-DNA-[protein]-cysteine S-methyltransferase